MAAYPIVERATLAPAQCMFTKNAQGPFIDLLRDFDFDHEGRMYVQVQFARQLGELAGLPSSEDLALERSRRQIAEAERDRLEAEIQELREFKASVDTIVSADYVTRKKQGRPTTAKAA